MNPLRTLFTKVVFTCTECGARQRIPLRRVHFFERFHDLTHGEVILIACPVCGEGLQVPAPYHTHTGQETHFDPNNPDNAVIHAT
jgi:RNase P subunit RPR2